MYRINYGNTQVSGSFKSLSNAREFFALCDGYAYLERRENGEWFPCHAKTGYFLDMTDTKNAEHPAYYPHPAYSKFVK